VGLPWQDTGTETGVSDAIAAVKWRFWEKNPWSLGVRAGFSFPTGGEQRGLGNGKTTWAAQLIGQYEGERWIFLSHLGYRRNHNSVGDRESIGEISGAVLYKATATLKLAADASRTTSLDPGSSTAARNLVLGAIYAFSKDLDLDAGVRWGNDPALADRAVMAGITLRW